MPLKMASITTVTFSYCEMTASACFLEDKTYAPLKTNATHNMSKEYPHALEEEYVHVDRSLQWPVFTKQIDVIPCVLWGSIPETFFINSSHKSALGVLPVATSSYRC